MLEGVDDTSGWEAELEGLADEMTVASVLVEPATLDEPTGPEYRLDVLREDVGIASVLVSPLELDEAEADGVPGEPLGAV